MTIEENFLRNLVKFAYDHGYHEGGYDPVDAVKAQARAEGRTEEAKRIVDVVFAAPNPKSKCDCTERIAEALECAERGKDKP